MYRPQKGSTQSKNMGLYKDAREESISLSIYCVPCFAPRTTAGSSAGSSWALPSKAPPQLSTSSASWCRQRHAEWEP